MCLMQAEEEMREVTKRPGASGQNKKLYIIYIYISKHEGNKK